jgi:hypothetical protein
MTNGIITTFIFILLFASANINAKTDLSKVDHIENEFIQINVAKGPDEQGRFSLETTLGDPKTPSDDAQPLIFGRPSPWTSYTTVRINGQDYIFGGQSKRSAGRIGSSTTLQYGDVVDQRVKDNEIITTCNFDGVFVTQKISLIRSSITAIKDTALITYDVENRTEEYKSVGIRIMLDTKLGSNDASPFRHGDKAITSEIKFSRAEMYPFWQTFDNLSSPNIIAQGTLQAPEFKVSEPDALYLVNWGTLYDHPWTFEYEKERSFLREGEFEQDTAMAMYWYPKSLNPKSSKQYRTLYGLGGITVSSGSLSIGLTSSSTVSKGKNSQFLIMGYILNAGGFDSYNTTTTYVLPDGFRAVKGALTHQHGQLKKDSTIQVPMLVELENSVTPGVYTIGLSANSDTFEENMITRSIRVLGPPKLSVNFIVPEEIRATRSIKTNVVAHIQNNTPIPLENVDATLNVDTPLALPSYELTRKPIGRLNPKESRRVNWDINVNDQDLRQHSVTLEVNSHASSKQTFRSNFLVTKPDSSFQLKASSSNILAGDAFYVELSAINLRTLDKNTIDFEFDDHYLRLVRISQEPWLRQKGISITHNNRQLSLSTPEYFKKNLEDLPIVKLHFKAIRAGATELRLQKNSETDTILPINIGDPR